MLILVVPAGMITDVKTVSVYRFIPVTVYVMSKYRCTVMIMMTIMIINNANLGSVAGNLTALVLLLSMMMVLLVSFHLEHQL